MVGLDAGYAAWLKADALTIGAATPIGARWPQGVTASGPSPFVTPAGAASEGQRRAAFLQGPLVRDRLVVLGEARALIGRCVRIVVDGLDYASGAAEPVFVLKVEERADGTSILSVLRRLT